jgi:hypothetical protein
MYAEKYSTPAAAKKADAITPMYFCSILIMESLSNELLEGTRTMSLSTDS